VCLYFKKNIGGDMQKRVLLVLFFVVAFQGCKKTLIQPPETLPWFNSIQIEPNVKHGLKYVTIVGSYIQFQVIPADSDRIDTGFSYLWESKCGGSFSDTLEHAIPSDSLVKINVARWHPVSSLDSGQIHITIYDSRDSSKDTLINVSVLPYKYEGEILDSSLQMPTGFGISTDKIGILDAKDKSVHFYSRATLGYLNTLPLRDTLEGLVDIVFDEYDRMYVGSKSSLMRFVKSGDNYVFNTSLTFQTTESGRYFLYFYYRDGRIYFTSNNSDNLFSVYDTSLNKIYSVGESGEKAPKAGITLDDEGNIYVLYTDTDGITFLRKYDNDTLLADNLLPLDSLPDSTYFYNLFYLNNTLYLCGSSPDWDGIYLLNPTTQNLGYKWGAGGNSPDMFSLIADAEVRGDTFYLLDTGNKALKIYTPIK